MTGQQLAALLAELGSDGPAFSIRRGGCGCLLGAVHNTRLAGYVVAGKRQIPMTDVPKNSPGVRIVMDWYLQSLEQPAQQFEAWGCRDATGVLPLPDLLRRAREGDSAKPFVI